MFSRENRRRNRERLLQAAGIHQVTKDDEAFVAKLEASKNLEKRLDDARRCVYEYSLALHALSDKSASLATALAALSDDAHGDAQQALNELQTHEIKLRRTHAPAALHALQELVGAPLDGAAAGSKDVERLTKARRDKLLDCDSFAARGDERLEAARRDLQHLTASCEAAFVAFSEAVGDATARCAGALSGVVAHFHCGVADAACARCESAPSSRLATHAAAALGLCAANAAALEHGPPVAPPVVAAPAPDDLLGLGTATPPPAAQPVAHAFAAAPPPPAARVAPPVLPARPTQEVTAAYAYQGQRASDLSFNAGDVIVVTRKKANGWWVGHVRGRDPATAGEFPSNYVR